MATERREGAELCVRGVSRRNVMLLLLLLVVVDERVTPPPPLSLYAP